MAEKRINSAIRVPEVRLIDQNGEQVGVVATADALARAEAENLDLVEISPMAAPPVCRIMDFGKYRFEEEKRVKEARKKQKIVHLKEIKFRPKIDEHDFDFKVKGAVKFLSRGDKVKITVRFRGREMAHPELGFNVIDKVKDHLAAEIGIIEEKKAAFEGRNIIMVLAPGKKGVKKASAKGDDTEQQDPVPAGDVPSGGAPAEETPDRED